MAISLQAMDRGDFTLIELEIPGGVCSPDDLASLDLPAGLDHTKGLVLSGRGPVWLFCHLAHLAHPFAWVGTHDPRLGGAVVVQRHHPRAPDLGAVLPV